MVQMEFALHAVLYPEASLVVPVVCQVNLLKISEILLESCQANIGEKFLKKKNLSRHYYIPSLYFISLIYILFWAFFIAGWHLK